MGTDDEILAELKAIRALLENLKPRQYAPLQPPYPYKPYWVGDGPPWPPQMWGASTSTANTVNLTQPSTTVPIPEAIPVDSDHPASPDWHVDPTEQEPDEDG